MSKQPKLDKTIFTINSKVKHTIDDFPYLQAVAYGYLGKPVPKMIKELTSIRKHKQAVSKI
jgi:hypothetical protein